ncbi:MAG TPA: hypothetical protein DC042_09760 [Bacteroidales bacterium]|nr:hypothetical protein [Bacteroidales bacterium]
MFLGFQSFINLVKIIVGKKNPFILGVPVVHHFKIVDSLIRPLELILEYFSCIEQCLGNTGVRFTHQRVVKRDFSEVKFPLGGLEGIGFGSGCRSGYFTRLTFLREVTSLGKYLLV